MYPMKNVKLGIAPIAWTNDDMPELGAEISFETCIDEMAESGFKGTEIGNKYPQNPTELKKELDKRGLQVCNAWFSSFLTTKPLLDTVDAFNKQLSFLHAMGAKCIGVAEQGHSIQGLMDVPVFEQKPIFTEEEWQKMIKGLNILGDLANSKGMKLAYHHHMGTGVQTAAEIGRLMKETDPDKVYLLYDTGHLVYSGEDHIMILKKFINRIVHVHLKDIRSENLDAVKRDKMSFLKGVKLGVFTVPGDGMIDFDPVFKELSESGYEGWLIVEAEQDPAVANPLKYANMARAFIQEKTGL